ncbi:amino acid ABC transporter substrate-binding protein [Azospirillum thiophilum]|uniref:Amino acid ABC transporter substrate-binding protein n=1 Tax=Azospirillum thiophilum TaxID=528244 RepID=A0AAC8W4S7_9PROT|nr:amino acid ABC transporter substrate-binding protein [Azospirillum thiophilum]KJR62388.1 amino acid ABC transporter substrate-binding protein [Azospirillum thiophilum]
MGRKPVIAAPGLLPGLFLGLLLALAGTAAAQQGASPPPVGERPVLAEIERRGVVRCGVSFNPGFAANDDNGRPVGFMVDLCRALAAAVLGKADAIEIRRLSKPQEFAAVAAGDVDVSFAQTSWTLTRDATYAVDFGPPVFHDVQGIAAWRLPDGRSALESGELTICVPVGTTTQAELEALLARGDRPWKLRLYPGWPDALEAFLSRDCAALSADRAPLTTALHVLEQPRGSMEIADAPLASASSSPELSSLPSREPITPLTPNADRMWMAAVRWTMYALFLADDAGVTGANANFQRITGSSEMRRLLSGLPQVAVKAGLRPDWAYQAIVQVGNYGEIFERNLGAHSPFKLERGPNRPWTQGGLLYAPVFQ